MDEITVGWEEDEGAYIVRQSNDFIYDTTDLLVALTMALAVGEANDQRVVVTSVYE